MLRIDTSAVPPQKLEALLPQTLEAHRKLQARSGAGAEYTGWVTLPGDYDRDEYQRLLEAAERVAARSGVLVVVGIGGSYLGSRAVIDFLLSPFYNGTAGKKTPDILFAGCNLSGAALQKLTERIGERDFTVNVISKSGGTTEPAVAFRYFRALAEKRYGKEGAKKRIIATTDKARGVLKSLSGEMGYETFVIPDGVGGRYSVLTPVGLLPIAAAGIDTGTLLAGARTMMDACKTAAGLENPALAYAAARNALYEGGKKTEVLASFDPDFVYMGEWWKQLYGESEGKEGKGLFPAAVSYTADLHSMGQYMQQGERTLFETFVRSDTPRGGITVGTEPGNADGLNFLAGKTIDAINDAAYEGTKKAHTDGGVPCLTVDTGPKGAEALGELIYFFEYACGVSGYMLGVNPFDQPGVEAYKKNMFTLLGKPG
ncbi:MAG: glucose-6-phosphate isomerase [Oscillospiraceae bacterium]|jgi:glucose-6-phosphate isomerase|nr:glucose-6-phosphate isomerase [Oscillospiraceae bacterium]